MRARNIKPGFFKNEDLLECSMPARLLAPGLWMMADREGRLEDRPKRIKLEIFPGDDVNIEALLGELVRAKHILRYRQGENNFIQILKFKEHQRPHSNETASIIPEYSETSESVVTKEESAPKKEESTSSLTTDSLNPSSLNPSSLNHAPSGAIKKTRVRKTYTTEFEEFHKVYPKNAGSKEKAFSSYLTALKETTHAELIRSAGEYAAYIGRTGKFEQNGSTWLNQRGWETDYASLGHGSQQGRDSRDPAKRADDEAQRIIAERRAKWAAEDAVKAGSGGAGAANPAAVASLRQPENLRGQGRDDGLSGRDVPDDSGGFSVLKNQGSVCGALAAESGFTHAERYLQPPESTGANTGLGGIRGPTEESEGWGIPYAIAT